MVQAYLIFCHRTATPVWQPDSNLNSENEDNEGMEIEVIENELELVKSFDTRINDVMNRYDFDSKEAIMYNEELDGQAQFVIDTGVSLDK